MLTNTEQKNLYGELTTGTANITNMNLGEKIMNAETRRLVSKMSDNLLHTTGTAQVVANQQVYELPNRMKKLRSVVFTIGSNTYYADKVPNRRAWDILNNSTSTAYTSDYPEWYYIINRQILYWPTPSSGSAVITYDYDKKFIDSTIEDYTTGTIQTATYGSTTIVGSGTTWGSAMVGRYLKIEKSDTYANDGDGDYYEINSISSTTQLDIVKTYEGHSISSGSASYRIGEVSPLPDGFHEIPVYRGVEFYYSKVDQGRSKYFRQLASDLEVELMAANAPTDLVSVEEDDNVSDNPNLYPTGLNG